jgi:hypothetical protein
MTGQVLVADLASWLLSGVKRKQAAAAAAMCDG